MSDSNFHNALFDGHPQALWIHDPLSLRLLRVNEAALRLFGYDRQEFLALTVADLLPEEAAASPDAERCRDGGTRRGRRRDGGALNLQVVYSEIGLDGRPAIFSMATPVGTQGDGEAARLPAEAAADDRDQARRDAQLQAILEHGPECVKIVDAAGTLLEMNAAGLRMVEAAEAGQVVGRPAGALVHPDDRPLFHALHRQALAGEDGDAAYRLVGLAGRTRWVESHATPLREADGSVGRVLSVARDVTERRQAEAALREIQRRNELILASTVDGIHGTDEQGRIVFENRASLAMLGYEAREVEGRQAHPLMHHHHADGRPYRQEDCPINRTLIDGVTRHVENEVFFRKDGSSFPVEYDCAAMIDPESGRATGVVVNFRDVTAKRRQIDLRALETHVLDLLSAGAELNRVLRDIAETVDRLIPGLRSSILLADKAGGLSHGVGPGLPDGLLRRMTGSTDEVEAGPWDTAVRRGRPVVVTDARDDPLCEPFRALLETAGLNACRSQPILSSDAGVLAAFTVFYPGPQPPAALDDDLVSRIGQYVRTAIERHRAREALAESEERFRSLAEHIQEVFWMTDVTKSRMHYVSPAYEAIWVRSCASLYANPTLWHQAIHEADRERVLAASLRQEEGTYDEEYRVVRPDGSIRWINDRAYLVRNADGTPRWIVGTARDVTARKNAEVALRERLKELRCLYAILSILSDQARSLPDVCQGVVDSLPQGFLHADAAVARIELDGQSYRSGGWREPAAAFGAPLHRAGNRVGRVDVGYLTPDGDATDGQDLFLPEERDMLQAIASHIGQMLDSREMASRLTRSERLSAIGQLTGGVAHDFNNLLTVVLGNAETLAESLAHEPALRALAEMTADAAQRGAELTGRLLAFARRQPLDPKVTDIGRLLSGMRELLRRTLGEQYVIEFSQPAGLRPAMIDASQLESAILNLCLNARDAMAEGGKLKIATAQVSVDATAIDAPGELASGDYVTVAVSDSGIGMDSRTVERAFEPFFTTKEVGKGSGLGLSMVYGFAKQSKGLARIDSRPGEGTTVTLFLPCANPQDAAAGVARECDPGAGRGERILLVEDDDLVRGHVTRQLESLGYEVEAATNGAEAIALLARGRQFALLFTDIVMPGGMSGQELADKVRASHPALPILFTSGYTEDRIAGRMALDPSVRFLAKPYRRKELAAKVRDAIERG